MQIFEIRKVLVPFDFSELSYNAITTSTAICKRQNASMTFLYVPYERTSGITEINTEVDDNNITQQVRNALLNKLKKIAEEISTANKISVEVAIRIGNVEDNICSFALESRADLIVMGAYGTAVSRERIKGSKAYDVIKHSHIPVLTVPSEGTWTHFEKVLFPVRMVNGIFHKYEVLRPIIARNNSSLTILGLVKNNNSSELPEISDLLHDFKLKLAADEVTYEAQLYYGNKHPEKILETARIHDSDLIVITASPNHSIKDFFISPYAQRIVNYSKIPVLTVKPRIDETIDVVNELREFEREISSSPQLAM